jgi:hypothetical protein
VPLIADYQLAWRGNQLHLEGLHHVAAGVGEAALTAPPWDELVAGEADEAAFWELVDEFAAAVEARFGAIVDGEPIELEAAGEGAGWRRRLRGSLGLLLPEGDAGWLSAEAAVYRSLPRSGLLVLLR